MTRACLGVAFITLIRRRAFPGLEIVADGFDTDLRRDPDLSDFNALRIFKSLI